MGNLESRAGGRGGGRGAPEKRKWEPPPPPTFGKKKKPKGPSDKSDRLPHVTPVARCKLRLQRLERVNDYLLLESEFLDTVLARPNPPASAAEEVEKLEASRGLPMQVATLEDVVDDDHCIVSSSGEYYVPLLSFVDKEVLEPMASVLLHNRSMAIVGALTDDSDPLVEVMKVQKGPLESYADIGGLEEQIQEIKEAVEYPLTHPELYEEIGIKPPKGVILFGEPGTGKTLLARAVARETKAEFLHVVGSELVQKYLGEGPKLVREVFRAAESCAPAIIFIDEIDAVGTKRYDAHSSGEKEIQRTMLELLNQLDGFDDRSHIKVIMATNKIESLDPALIRPGRVDRKIEFPMPDAKTKRMVFDIHTRKMALAGDVNLDEFVQAKDDLSGADIKAIATEAGLLAMRERRMRVCQADFTAAKESVLYRKRKGAPPGMYL